MLAQVSVTTMSAARVRFIALGRGDHHLETELARGIHPRVADIVAVADPGDAPAFDGTARLDIGLDVGQQLARMIQVGERVDHRHA
jgi:hypothetical protein